MDFCMTDLIIKRKPLKPYTRFLNIPCASILDLCISW